MGNYVIIITDALLGSVQKSFQRIRRIIAYPSKLPLVLVVNRVRRDIAVLIRQQRIDSVYHHWNERHSKFVAIHSRIIRIILLPRHRVKWWSQWWSYDTWRCNINTSSYIIWWRRLWKNLLLTEIIATTMMMVTASWSSCWLRWMGPSYIIWWRRLLKKYIVKWNNSDNADDGDGIVVVVLATLDGVRCFVRGKIESFRCKGFFYEYNWSKWKKVIFSNTQSIHLHEFDTSLM